MTQIPSTGGSSTTNTNPLARPQSTGDAMSNLDMDHFFKMMIEEMKNQDPLNPMDNTQLMQQIGQIREIGASEKLSGTLESVLLGQNVATATSLLGKHVRGINDRGSNVEGQVERVTIIDGEPRLHVGTEKIKLSNVGDVLVGEE